MSGGSEVPVSLLPLTRAGPGRVVTGRLAVFAGGKGAFLRISDDPSSSPLGVHPFGGAAR
jgi:hypothetical protein